MVHALLIDDNPTNLEILKQMLEFESVTCTVLTDPLLVESTVQSLASLDVIFLDLEMPGLTGYDVLTLFSRLGISATVPVIAHTVHLSQIGEARSHGFHSFIGKPLNMDKFPAQLARILQNQSVWVGN